MIQINSFSLKFVFCWQISGYDASIQFRFTHRLSVCINCCKWFHIMLLADICQKIIIYLINLGDSGFILWNIFKCLSSLLTGFPQLATGQSTLLKYVFGLDFSFLMAWDRIIAWLWDFLCFHCKWLTTLVVFISQSGHSRLVFACEFEK
jgi:hypothetical protein